MKNLIVNADDFGLTKSINEGIEMAFNEGIVTAAGLLPSGEAFDDALRCARKLGLKEIGAHLALTETGPTLAGGKFYKSHKELLAGLLRKRVDLHGIRAELKNQLDMIKGAGIRITNLSSHEHVHMIPPVLDIFIGLAKEYEIPFIRYPRRERVIGSLTPGKIYRKLILSYFGKSMKGPLEKGGVRYSDYFFGFLESGKLTESTLTGILSSLKGGMTELVCHPGFLGPEVVDRYRFHLNCETELAALTSRRIKKLVADEHINLRGWL